MVRMTSRMSPSVSRNRAAARSTRPGGGVSETKRRASLVAMYRALAGCIARRLRPPRQLGGDDPRRRRMPRQDVEHALAVRLPAAALDRQAEHGLLSRVMQPR